jgi:hypothetical protein
MGATGNNPNISAPNYQDVMGQYFGNLSGYTQGMPLTFAAERQWKPRYTELGLQNTGRELYGTQNAPGLLSMYGDVTGAMAGAQNRANLISNVGLTQNLGAVGPAAFQAYQGMNPDQAGLMSNLSRTAQQGLAAGSSMTPDQNRLFSQQIRGAQAARGMGYGPSDVFNESMGLTQFGNQLQQQRQQFGQGVAQLGQQYQAPLLSALLGQSNAPMMGQNFLGGAQQTAMGAQPTMVNPQTQYDIYNTGYNATAAANIANQNSQVAMEQGFNSFD